MVTRLAALALMVLAPGNLCAQEAEAAGETFGSWVKNCRVVPEERTLCRLFQTLTRTEDGSLVVRVAIIAQPESRVLLVAQVPAGTYLGTQPALRAKEPADSPSLPMIWQQCLAEICEAARTVTAEELDSFTASGGFLFGYRPKRDADPVIVPLGTDGLREGLAALAVQ